MTTIRFGFTIVELLIVVSIIAILLMIVANSGGETKSLAQVTVAEQDVEQIGLALRLYQEANGSLPSESDRSDWFAAAQELTPTYLSKDMTNDVWGQEFRYQNNFAGGVSARGSFICSVGPNGTFETTDILLQSYQPGGDDICQFIFDED